MDIQTVVDQLKSLNPDAIVLYGSHAWGTPHADSDIDLLIIQQSKKTFWDRQKEAKMCIRSTIPTDILVLTPHEAKTLPQHNSFIKSILSRGKVLYGRI